MFAFQNYTGNQRKWYDQGKLGNNCILPEITLFWNSYTAVQNNIIWHASMQSVK